MKYRSTLFDEARNKIGSAVASKNRNGNYFRNLVIPANPKSAKQQEVRGRFTANSQAWRALTETQRQGWISLSQQVTLRDALGNTYNPTGQQLYISCSTNQQIAFGGSADDPPATPDTVSNPDNLQIVATIGSATPFTQTLTEQVDHVMIDNTILVYATAQFSAGRSFVGPSQYRLITTELPPQSAPVSILTAYQATFGNLVAGSKLSVKIIAISVHGFASQPVRQDVIVSAV